MGERGSKVFTKEKEFEFIGESISTVINTLSSSNSDIEMLEKSIKKARLQKNLRQLELLFLMT